MKQIIFIAALLFSRQSFSQDLKTFKLYKPGENAEQQLGEAVIQAKAGESMYLSR